MQLNEYADKVVDHYLESTFGTKDFIFGNKTNIPPYFCNPVFISATKGNFHVNDFREIAAYLKEQTLKVIGNNLESVLNKEINLYFFPIPLTDPYQCFTYSGEKNKLLMRFIEGSNFGMHENFINVKAAFLMVKTINYRDDKGKIIKQDFQVIRPQE